MGQAASGPGHVQEMGQLSTAQLALLVLGLGTKAHVLPNENPNLDLPDIQAPDFCHLSDPTGMTDSAKPLSSSYPKHQIS